MGITWTKLGLKSVGEETNFRLDHARYLGEEKFSEFISEFDRTASLGTYVSSIRNGVDISKDKYTNADTGILYLSVQPIASGPPGKLVLEEAEQLNLDLEGNTDIKVQPDEVLVTRSGTPGVAWYAEKKFLDKWDAVIPSGYTQRLKFKEGSIDSRFLAGYLNLPPVRMLTTACACGKDQFNLSQDYLRQIPVPTLSEDRVDEFIELVTEYQKIIQEAYELVGHLEKLSYQRFLGFIKKEYNLSGAKISRDVWEKFLESLKLEEVYDQEAWKLPKRRGE